MRKPSKWELQARAADKLRGGGGVPWWFAVGIIGVLFGLWLVVRDMPK